ncbi:MAG TPA: extracellular solute-binding protein [Microbacterium sp.]|nr:extracellular solute-binding protein [Microbacterium sp.]
MTHISPLRAPAVAVMAASALILAGCTGGAPDAGGDGETLRYLVEQPEDPAALKALQDHLAEFSEESGIDVKVEAMPFDTMRTVLQTQLRSGDGPDVFNWGSGPGFGGVLAEAGLLYDLTDAYAEYDWPIYDFAKERVTFEDTLYGIPGEMETIGLFYNKDLFAEHGLEAPKNLAELADAADVLAGAGIVPIAASDQEGWQGGHLLSMALSSRVGSAGMDALISGETSWDSPDVVASLQLWQDYLEAGRLPEFPTSLSYDGASALFYSGDAAMVPTGSWLISEIDDNAEFEVGYIPFPAEDGPGIFAGGLGSGPMIAANTTKPDAALELVNYLASPEHGQWMVENLNVIPPQPIDTEDLEVSPLFRQVLDDTAKVSDGTGDFGYNIDVLMSDGFNETMLDGVAAILSGQMTAAEVAAQMQTASEK